MTVISADPTKEFFISMLTRDISLTFSIIDLIDNSADAALASGGYAGKFVKINYSPDQFEIIDNCGGISRVAAAGYAFKFGRPSTAPLSPHSVGRFGVGMKRALFKIGTTFSVESDHPDGSFKISVNEAEWLRQEGPWSFNLSECNSFLEENGTQIKICNLHTPISEKFSDHYFTTSLINEIEKAHYKILRQGFCIEVNGQIVGLKDIGVINNENLGIIGKSLSLGEVSVTIKIGIGSRDYHAAGWYILCNNRMIENANKGSLTGWGVDGMPNFHPDFAYFRGVVEFNSEDGGNLPWNTTKSGVDTDNRVYRTTLIFMKQLMRKVTELLRERTTEQENQAKELIEDTPIINSIEDVPFSSIFDINIPDGFLRPSTTPVTTSNPFRRISYLVEDTSLSKAKLLLGATTNRDVGELTFKYFLSNESE